MFQDTHRIHPEVRSCTFAEIIKRTFEHPGSHFYRPNVSPFFLSLHTFEPFCLFILTEVEKRRCYNSRLLFSQANWGMLEMKPHESKKQGQNKSEKEGEKQRTIKNQIKKGEKTIKR
jgi:hypothetical protein